MIKSCFGKQPNVNQIKMLFSLDRSGVSLLGMTDCFDRMKDRVYDSWLQARALSLSAISSTLRRAGAGQGQEDKTQPHFFQDEQ